MLSWRKRFIAHLNLAFLCRHKSLVAGELGNFPLNFDSFHIFLPHLPSQLFNGHSRLFVTHPFIHVRTKLHIHVQRAPLRWVSRAHLHCPGSQCCCPRSWNVFSKKKETSRIEKKPDIIRWLQITAVLINSFMGKCSRNKSFRAVDAAHLRS